MLRIHLPMQGIWVLSLGREDPLEKGMVTHSSILAWRIPWTEESGGLQSMDCHKETDMTERLSNNNMKAMTSQTLLSQRGDPVPGCLPLIWHLHSGKRRGRFDPIEFKWTPDPCLPLPD